MDKAKADYVPPTTTRSTRKSGGPMPKFETDRNKSSRNLRSQAAKSSTKGKSRKRVIEDSDISDDDHHTKRVKVDVEDPPVDNEESQAFQQPVLITGANLKGYQREGVAWMVGLYQNGISGILGISPIQSRMSSP